MSILGFKGFKYESCFIAWQKKNNFEIVSIKPIDFNRKDSNYPDENLIGCFVVYKKETEEKEEEKKKLIAVKAERFEYDEAIIKGKHHKLEIYGIPRTGFLFNNNFYFTETKGIRLKVKL